MSVFSAISQMWMWCLSLFGLQSGQKGKGGITPSSLDTASNTPIDRVTLTHLQDISAGEDSFVSRHVEYYRDLSLRHGAPNYKLYFHYMSGAAVYLPSQKKNILFERLFYSLDPGKGHRAIVDKSFVVYTPWNANWTAPLSGPKILPINETAGSIYIDDNQNKTRQMEGPEDPRAIYDEGRDQVHVNFNILTHDDDRQMFEKSFKFIVSKDNSTQVRSVNHLTQFQHAKGYRAGTEKNWVPILIGGELQYVYSLSPLRIIRCEDSNGQSSTITTSTTPSTSSSSPIEVTKYKKVCTVQFKGEPVGSGSQTGALRSGTNWIEFSPGVFFSLARTRFMHKKCKYGLYRPHLLVLRFEVDSKDGSYTQPRIIYASEPITRFDDKIFQIYDNRGLANGDKCDDRAVLTPGSISKWTGMDGGDLTDVVISVNDDMNILLKIQGLGAVVQHALDSEPSPKKSRSLAKKNAVTSKAERQMKKFIEKSFAKVFQGGEDKENEE